MHAAAHTSYTRVLDTRCPVVAVAVRGAKHVSARPRSLQKGVYPGVFPLTLSALSLLGGFIRMNHSHTRSNHARDLHVEAPPNQVLLVDNGGQALEDGEAFQKYFSWSNGSPRKAHDAFDREVACMSFVFLFVFVAVGLPSPVHSTGVCVPSSASLCAYLLAWPLCLLPLLTCRSVYGCHCCVATGPR